MSMVAFLALPPTGDRQKGDFRTVSQVPREQLRRGKPGEWTGALPAGARLSICLGRWRGVWWCGYPWRVITPPFRRHLLPACQQPRQPPASSPPPDLHLRSQGRRQALHCARLHARVLLLVSTSDAGRRAAAAATNQDGSGRAIAASAASAGSRGHGCRSHGGPKPFHPSSVHGCHGGATSFDTLLGFSDTLGYAAGRILHVETGQDVG